MKKGLTIILLLIAYVCAAQFNETKQPDSLYRINKVKVKNLYIRLIIPNVLNPTQNDKILESKDTFDINGNLIKTQEFRAQIVRPEPSSTTENKYDYNNKLISSITNNNLKLGVSTKRVQLKSYTIDSSDNPYHLLIQTINNYEYKLDNKLIKRYIIDSMIDGTINNSTEEYFYDENKRIVKSTIKTSSGLLKEERIYTYSPKTILTRKYNKTGEIVFTILNEGDEKLKKTTNRYKNGQLSTSDWVIYKCKLNRKGQLTKSIPTEYSTQKGVSYSSSEYSYYKNGLMKSVESFITIGHQESVYWTYEYEYY